MRTFTITATSPASVDLVWKYYSSIHNYPAYVPFLKKIIMTDPVAEGSYWEDVTVILWIPMTIPHIITSLKPQQEISFTMTLPFHGTMSHVYGVKKHGEGSRVQCTITFDLGNPVINFLLGALLERRLRYMVTSILQTIEQNHAGTVLQTIS